LEYSLAPQVTARALIRSLTSTKKPHTVTLLFMPDRVLKVVDDWGRCHAKEDITHSLTFLNCKKELYDWDNDNLQVNNGLIKPDNHPDISHPKILA
jgi:hypothetical protein